MLLSLQREKYLEKFGKIWELEHYPKRLFTLILPANRLTEYVTKEQAIFAKDSTYLKEYLNPENVKKKMAATSTIYYRVKKGDTLGAIASRHRVTTKQLMAWNGLKNANRLSVGQRLRIQKR